MPIDIESNRTFIEVILGAVALAGSAVGAILFAGRTLGRVESAVTSTHDSVQQNAILNTSEHTELHRGQVALTAEQVAIRVSISDQGKLIIKLIDEGSSVEKRITKLESNS